MSINSSAIQLVWRPSSSLADIDIGQLSGNFTVSLYVGTRIHVFNEVVIYDASKLNTTGTITIVELAPDTVYDACFDSKWYEQNTTIEDDSRRKFPPNKCRLLRTYATDEVTLNSVPSIGSYSWEQIVTSNGTTAVNITARVSSELPYTKRDINVLLGSQSQTKKFEIPVENIEFLFDKLDSKSYEILLMFTLSDDNNTQTVRNATTGMINIKKNNGHRQLTGDLFLLLFVALSIFCRING